MQSASAVRREQRRAAAVEAAIAAVSRPASASATRTAAAAAALADASALRAAAYSPTEVESTVPPEHRTSSRLPIFTGHMLTPADRDHGFTLHDEGI